MAGGDQAGLVGEDDDLDTVAEAELGQDPGHVSFDGGLADEQAVSPCVSGMVIDRPCVGSIRWRARFPVLGRSGWRLR